MEIFILVSGLILIIASNTSSTKVTLLPSDKENTQISVVNESGSQVVDKVGEATTVGSKSISPTRPVAVDLEKVQLEHASLFAIQPQKADTFLLYFENNGTNLINESKLLLTTIINSANARKAPIINIIGHSDAAGSSEYNYKLSYERATSVAKLLQTENIIDAEYRIESHGENDPLIKSGKETEPKNRRVEVEIW